MGPLPPSDSTPDAAPDPPSASDDSLLRQLKEGDQDAATQLYLRYAERIRYLLRARLSRKTGQRVEAEDLVQSVFRRFFQAASEGRYHLPAAGDLWDVLLVIALNRLRAEEVYQRAAKRDVRRSVDLSCAEAEGGGKGADQEVERQVLAVIVRDALERLPEHFRQAVQLRLEGQEVAEIARQMDRSKRTVERILQEAFRQLRHLLGEGE